MYLDKKKHSFSFYQVLKKDINVMVSEVNELIISVCANGWALLNRYNISGTQSWRAASLSEGQSKKKKKHVLWCHMYFKMSSKRMSFVTSGQMSLIQDKITNQDLPWRTLDDRLIPDQLINTSLPQIQAGAARSALPEESGKVKRCSIQAAAGQ